MTGKPSPRRQCAKCPWKKGVNPHDIPNGYSVEQHKGLKNTIAEPGDLRGSPAMMACHETSPGNELPCVGWLVQQLGEGNNIGLRLQVHFGHLDANVETVGPQHRRFEDTLPKKRRAKKKAF